MYVSLYFLKKIQHEKGNKILLITSHYTEWGQEKDNTPTPIFQNATWPKHLIQIYKVHYSMINSLIPGRCICNFKCVMFKHIVMFSVKLPLGDCHRTSLVKSQHWIQVMAWCHQTTSHYLNQCWTLYGFIRPQWVNRMAQEFTLCHSWLTHCGLVTPFGDRDLGQHWFR